MNVVAHNLTAINSNRQYGIVNKKNAKRTEKLSSGYRINRAADDAAGLAISEKMRKQIRGLTQGTLNAQDGVSFCQVADGCLNEVTDILQRINELSIKAATGTISDSDRANIDDEIQELKKETTRIFNTGKFNETYIFATAEPPAIIPKGDDTYLFNIGFDENGDVLYGGVEINDVRHTWSELGFSVSSDGKTFTADKTVSFHDYTGELVELNAKAGESVTTIARRNKWSADEKGVYINDLFAQTWEEIAQNKSENGDAYTVKYKNQVIGFNVEGSSKSAAINYINGTSLGGKFEWDITASGQSVSKAIDINARQTLTVTEANKRALDADYYISIYGSGDNGGITIRSTDGVEHTKIDWKDFKNVSGDPEAPIADWGLSDIDGKGRGSDAVSFDDDAKYRYRNTANTDLNIQFYFKLADDTGFNEVKNAINEQKYEKTFSAPNNVSASVAAGSPVSLQVGIQGMSTMTYEAQKAYGRDFDNPNATLTGTVTRKLNTDSGPTTTVTSINTYDYSESSTNSSSQVYYLNSSDGLYYLYDKTVTDYSVTAKGNRTRTDTYTAHYSYEDPDLNGNVLNSIPNGQSFNYYQDHYDKMERVGTYTRTEYALADSSAAGVEWDNVQASGIAVADNISGSTTTIEWGEWEQKSSTTGSFRKSAYLSDSITLNSSKGYVGTMSVRDNGAAIGDSTLNVKFTALGLASCTLSTDERTNYSVHNDMRNTSVITPPGGTTMKNLYLHVGPDSDNGMNLSWSALSNTILGIRKTNTKTMDDSLRAIDETGYALSVVAQTRSAFGAYQNRVEHTIAQNNNTMENTQAAESLIRDADMAKEMVGHANNSVLLQAGQAMMAQANQSNRGVLSLLG